MKKKKRKIKGSKIRMLILVPISLFIVGYFVYLLLSYPYNILRLKNEEKLYSQQLHQLEIDERNLKNEIEKLKDPDYLARYARENYQYSKDGEIILKLDSNKITQKSEIEQQNDNKILIFGGSFLIVVIIYIIFKSRH